MGTVAAVKMRWFPKTKLLPFQFFVAFHTQTRFGRYRIGDAVQTGLARDKLGGMASKFQV